MSLTDKDVLLHVPGNTSRSPFEQTPAAGAKEPCRGHVLLTAASADRGGERQGDTQPAQQEELEGRGRKSQLGHCGTRRKHTGCVGTGLRILQGSGAGSRSRRKAVAESIDCRDALRCQDGVKSTPCWVWGLAVSSSRHSRKPKPVLPGSPVRSGCMPSSTTQT